MCVIVYKKAGMAMPSMDVLADCWATNPHGAGFMFPEREKVSIRKGFMRWTEFASALSETGEGRSLADLPMAFHFRIATHGKVKPGCCHPFPVKADYEAMRKTETRADVGFMHNGTLRGLATSDSVSDSMAFAKSVLNPLKALCSGFIYDKSVTGILDNVAQGSRFLLMDGAGNVATVGDWREREGLMFSNLNHVSRFASAGAPAADARGGMGGYDGVPLSDMARLGLFEPCSLCPYAEWCLEDAPLCRSAFEAEAVSEGLLVP